MLVVTYYLVVAGVGILTFATLGYIEKYWKDER